MSRRFYGLPALSALSAFEAAARHGSFKRAALELNVTPGAVSHQIKALEDDLGLALFSRVHRGVELTPAGDRLARSLRGAFRDISDVVQDLRGRTPQPGVTVGATTAMSALWLTPVITQFWRSYPDMRVNQIVSDTLDFGGAKPDIVLSFAPYEEEGYTGEPLFRDLLLPVGAPGLAAEGLPETLADLARLPLVHLEAPDSRWTGWSAWFAELGYRGALRRGIRVNNYMIALQAAEEGLGMVLGWRRLVQAHLETGRLVALGDFAMPAPSSFFLSVRDGADADGDTRALAAWIRSVAARQSGELKSSRT